MRYFNELDPFFIYLVINLLLFTFNNSKMEPECEHEMEKKKKRKCSSSCGSCCRKEKHKKSKTSSGIPDLLFFFSLEGQAG